MGDLWFFGTKVALYRYFGVAGDVASGVVNGKWEGGEGGMLTTVLGTCRVVFRDHRPKG